MNTCIKLARVWLDAHPRIKQWAWFIVLWLGGLFAVLSCAYPIKWIIKSM